MRIVRLPLLLLFLLPFLLSACAGAPDRGATGYEQRIPPAYDYPIANPYAATVIATPPAYRDAGAGSADIKIRHLEIFPDRSIPEGFWYYRDGLAYGEMLQDHAAPLVYVIGGTGAGFQSRNSLALADILYRAGNHVVTLPSPTHSSFIVTAGSNFFPGNAANDADDLYRVIAMIQPRVERRADVTSTGLTGYSLGGWNAAFVAELDDRKRQVGFDRVLVIDPPLNLYSSIQRLDQMLLRGLPNGIDGLDAFLDNALARLSQVSDNGEALDFSNENMLWEGYQKLKPSDDRLATTIGLSFRISAANMIFTADVMSHAGYIYPKDRPFRSDIPLNDYLAVALRTGLGDYYRDIYKTYYLSHRPDGRIEDLVAESSLESLRGWLAGKPNVGLIANADDLILEPGEIDTLRGLFPGRATIYPTGGHLGNLQHRAVSRQIAQFFEGAKR